MREASAAEAPRHEREQTGAEQEFGMAGAEELARLENAMMAAKERAETDPETAKDVAIAEKQLELFLNEHDNAGAFKFKRLGREMVGYFGDPRDPDKPKVIEADKEGMLSLAEGEKDRRMMVVNMGELDRINKEGGGHGAGDAALRETVRTIEAIVLDRLKGKEGKETGYTMFRYSGNEFAVNFSSISKEDFDAILDAVREARPPVEGVDEPPPLVADGFDLQEAVDIVNQMQLELGPGERIDVSDPSAAAREMIDVMRRRANYSLDIDKFSSRVGRVKEKIAELGIDGARPFFENYMKKMFAGTELAELERFADVRDEDVDRMALENAKKFLGAQADRGDMVRDIVATRIKDIRERRGLDADVSRRPLQGPEAPGVYDASPTGAPLAEVPQMTDGQRRLADMEKAVADAEASGDPSDVELATLDLQIERARRDGGTGLLERGVHYESLEKAFKEGKEAQLVFVDMGFLKYFDHKGGPDVGDAALKLAASLMEKAIAKAEVKGSAYRYGGDEFTVQIDGGAGEVEKFQAALAELRAEAGAVPTGKRGTKDGYHPTELVFNYGSADTATAEQVFKDLEAAGKITPDELADPDRVANIKAEIMTMIADKAIEEEKAVNRFLMLIDSLRDPNYGSRSPARTTQVDNLINFSNKAIFAEAGGGEFLQRLAASEMGEQELRKEVQSWVAERVQEGREKEGRKEDLLSQLIELHGDIKFFERKLSKMRHENDEEKRRADSYLVELKKAREERQKLIDVRRTLSGEDKEAA
jgi:GGDEF domain-containing protein